MPTNPTIYSRRDLVTQAIRRLATYTSEITYYGKNSVENAIAETVGGATSQAYGLYRALARRITLLGSSGDQLTVVAAGRGARRRDAQRSRLLVVVVPWSATVTAITVGITTALEVDDASHFSAGSSIRVRNADGSVTERLTVISVSQGTGPNGDDELIVHSLSGSYAPSGDDIQVLLRHTLPLETVFTTKTGIGFRTTQAVTIGDFNPVLSGESSALALSDKVWCEAVVTGEAGNVDPKTISGLQTPDAAVADAYNPERGFGGADEESDHDLRYRAAHLPARRSEETVAWAESLAVEADVGVLRAVQDTPTAISTLELRLLAANGGPLQLKRLARVENYVGARVRSYMAVQCDNVDLVAIEIECQVYLDPDVTLRQAWVDASSRIANYLDYRRWPFGTSVSWTKVLGLVAASAGVRSVVESTFSPSEDVVIPGTGLPVLVRVSIQDAQTLQIINGELAVSFASSEAA